MGEKLTVKDWRRKTGLSLEALARLSEVSSRSLANAEKRDFPTTELVLSRYIIGLKKFFRDNPDLLGDLQLPDRPEDFKDVVIYDPNIHRTPRKSSKKHENSL